MNQMGPPMPQGHFMGMNPMHAGSLPTGGVPPPIGSFQGEAQMYAPGGSFNRAPAGQMPMMPGLNPYQSGNPNPSGSGMGTLPSNMGHPSGMAPPPPPPPGPPPHGQPTQ
ncbi:hypothetical protein PVL29_017438 [Vitis rotundifolia]|uniref:Uncharacterized protein n=1 Tax=Vitis rotundifolia TaxID=103349 RepID=A0AA38ZAS6_VITRO|nr:hypothetical protein PVL29_017438 [Vitis rotundifolia]